MKKTIILLAATVIAVVAVAQQFTASTKAIPVLTAAAFNWQATTFDFGKIEKGNPVTHEFTFSNSGSEPLIISSVQASCGCTVAEYTQEPISAGEKGFVKATYNAAKAGVFTKTITLKANTEGESVLLTITGEVVE